ncbi:MAG: cation diffusion facilitator family transporter [Trueperaceae bacterium]|nr:cation diffusion facilitator family transporter [Trueperaceae bacterium]
MAPPPHVVPTIVDAEASARRARATAARISLLAALVVLGLKGAAWLLTGSVSLLSDAAESLVNVTAAVSLLVALRIAARGPDLEHPYGHQKAEYLSSVFEASLILLAAGAIAVSAFQRLWAPQPLENVPLGLSVALLAGLLNAGLGVYLSRVGARLESPALIANGRHVLTDVWTSVGVLLGVGLVAVTGFERLDPLLALVVAAYVAREGVRILTANLSRLMDERLPEAEERVILDALASHPAVAGFHRLRTRRSGRARFAEVDLFVDPEMSVRAAHEVVAEVEQVVHARLKGLTTTMHVEPFVEGVREGRHAPAEEFAERGVGRPRAGEG